MTIAIWWVRRDLRLSDNQALRAALDNGDTVVPIFVLDPSLLASKYVGQKRLAFLFEGLRELDADLVSRGSRLIIRKGDPALVLRTLVTEAGAGSVHAERDVSPYARRRDARVAQNVSLVLSEGITVHPPESVLKSDGLPYTVYTPYSRTWKSCFLPERQDLLIPPTHLPFPHEIRPEIETVPVPESPKLSADIPFTAGEDVAARRLELFRDEVLDGYATERDRMDHDATSRLSPYIRFGMISARTLVVTALEARAAAETDAARRGAATWLNELIWREFYISILNHFPHVREQSFREAYRHLSWDNDPLTYADWQAGRTGYPVVDAGMRQLLSTGWMHNRARMIVASFLTKDLLIDWRWGEQHFMQHLIDGDPAANNGGWQWSAGTGTDAAPYFRIFNPTLQGKKYDPQGTYIRQWIPELRHVEARYIHEPWMMPAPAQERAGCIIGRNYPAPIIDHKRARERTLSAYKKARKHYG